MKNNSKPLITIIMPTYNRAKFLEFTLDNIFEQTYRPIELIVVDDGSEDETGKIVADWKKFNLDDAFQLKYIYQENKGAPAARNKGMEIASGDYLQFVDSDDYIMPEKLALQMDVLKTENTPLCICDYIHVDENDEEILKITNDFSASEIIREYRGTNTLIGLIKKSFLEKYRIKWNPKIKKLQDREFYTRIFMVVDKHSYVNKVLFKWIYHRGEDRIYMQKLHMREQNQPILRSLISFHIAHLSSISLKKYPAIFSVYKRLFRSAVNLGRIKTVFKKKRNYITDEGN